MKDRKGCPHSMKKHKIWIRSEWTRSVGSCNGCDPACLSWNSCYHSCIHKA